MPMPARPVVVAVVVALGLGCIAATAAAAPGEIPQTTAGQPAVVEVFPDNSFTWLNSDPWDLDQVRGTNEAAGKVGLPGNGQSFSAPTALTDLLLRLRDLGWSGPDWPASTDYTAPENYNAGTAAIKGVADVMGTVHGAGTSARGLRRALDHFLDPAERAGTVGLVGASSYLDHAQVSAPSPWDMAHAGAAGASILGHLSHYLPMSNDGTVLGEWNYGEEFTVVGAAVPASSFGTVKLATHMPFTEWTTNTVQGPMTINRVDLVRRVVKFQRSDGTSTTRTVWAEPDYPFSVFDGYTSIAAALTWAVPSLGKLQVSQIPLATGAQPLEQRTFSTPGDRAVVDIATTAAGPHVYVLLKGSSAIWRVDPVTGRFRAVAKGPRGARSLVVGGTAQDVFVAGAGELQALDAQTGRRLAQRTLAEPVRELAFLDRGGLVALDADGRALRAFSTRLKAGSVRTLGASQRFIATDRRGRIALGSAQQLATSAPAQASAAAARPLARASARVPIASSPRSITGLAVLDRGHFAISRGGRLELFDAAGKPVASPLAGIRSLGPIATNRAFDGFTSRSGIRSLDHVPDGVVPHQAR